MRSSAQLATQPGGVYPPTGVAYHDGMDILTDPKTLPRSAKGLTALPDDTLIGVSVWAALQKVDRATVLRNRVRAAEHRTAGKPRPGDMPDETTKVGQSPVWTLGQYRAWEKSRPGAGVGGGRPKGSGRGRAPRTARLPLTCPHCGHKVTAADLANADTVADALALAEKAVGLRPGRRPGSPAGTADG